MVDFEQLSDIFDNDQDVINAILTLYLEENVGVNERLFNLYQQEDWPGLFHLSHTLSGTLSNLCENDIIPLLRAIEHAAKVGSPPNNDTFQQTMIGLSKIEAQITSHIT